jgi:hypothetical protein
LLPVVAQDSGNNECVWAGDPDVPVEHTSLKFHVNQGVQPSEGTLSVTTLTHTGGWLSGWRPALVSGFKADLSVEVEIWSTFLA